MTTETFRCRIYDGSDISPAVARHLEELDRTRAAARCETFARGEARRYSATVLHLTPWYGRPGCFVAHEFITRALATRGLAEQWARETAASCEASDRARWAATPAARAGQAYPYGYSFELSLVECDEEGELSRHPLSGPFETEAD